MREKEVFWPKVVIHEKNIYEKQEVIKYAVFGELQMVQIWG